MNAKFHMKQPISSSLKIIAFILIMILTALIPVHSYGYNAASVQQTGTYYFSSNPVGSYPSNSTIFNFTMIGNSSTITAVTGKGTNGTGLLLSTCNGNGTSYLGIDVNGTYLNFSLSISFSWNYSRNFGFTEDYIALMSGTNEMLNLSFGPNNGYGLFEHGNSSTRRVSGEPLENTLCNLSISYASASVSSYFSFNANGQNSSLPLMYPAPSISVEHPRLILGGEISSFSIYSISIGNTSTYRQIPLSQTPVTPSKLIIQENPFDPFYYNYTWFDAPLNTLIGISSSNTIAAYNLENSTNYDLYAGKTLSGNLSIIAADSNTCIVYVLSNKTSSILFSVSKSNLSVSAEPLDSTLTGFGGIIGQNATYVLLGNNGEVAYIANWTLKYSFAIPDLYHAFLLNASIDNLIVKADWLLNNTVYRTTIYAQNSSFMMVSKSNLNSIPSFYTSLKLFSVSRNISSILSYGGNTTASYLTPAGAFGLGIEASVGMAAGGISGSAFSLYENGRTFLVSGKTIYSFAAVNASGFIPVAFSSFGIILLSSSSMVIYYDSSHALLSGRSPTAVVNATYVLRKQVKLDFYIQSTTQFTASLAFSNVSMKSGTSYFAFNSTDTEDASYPGYLNISNKQGYVTYYTTTIVVDNGNPDLVMSVANNSFVPENFALGLNFTFWAQIRNMSISYLGKNISLIPVKQTVSIAFANVTGSQVILIDLVDEFGVRHIYQLNVNVISNNTSGFEINLQNGTYLDSTHYVLAWSAVPYAEEYLIAVRGSGISQNISTKSTSTNLSLVNGNMSVSISVIQLDGRSTFLAERTINVVAYSPRLVLTGNSSGYYSFYGNSSNNTFILNVRSNSSASISLDVISPNGTVIFSTSAYDTLSLEVDSRNGTFLDNGIYEIRLVATGPSGLSYSVTITMNVNNTDPTPIYAASSHLYTNASLIQVGQGQIAGINYLYTLYNRGLAVEQSTGGIFTLLNGTGNYSIEVFEINAWSDHTIEDVPVTYETASPVINISQDAPNSQYIRYNIHDAASLKIISLQYLNHTIALNVSNTSGMLNLGIRENTVFNVTIYAMDACGNFASSETVFKITDFVNVTSSSLEAFSIFGIGFFHLDLSGQNTANASVTIRSTGDTSNGTLFIDYLMPLGYSTVTAVVSYNGHHFTLTRRVFSIGWYPLLSAIALFLVFMAIRLAGQSSDQEKIEELVLGYANHSLKEIKKQSVRWKIRKKALLATIDAMSRKGIIKVENDPDGEPYLMLQKNA
jgi:hypothetical protein